MEQVLVGGDHEEVAQFTGHVLTNAAPESPAWADAALL